MMEQHFEDAMRERPREINGTPVTPGLYRIFWENGGSSLAAIGMCINGSWWVAPTNWSAPATPLPVRADSEGRTTWASIERIERIDAWAAPLSPPETIRIEPGKLVASYTIPMILTCPQCGERHIDEGEFADVAHHTHACQGCGFVWRPAKVNTHGVQFLPGYKNVT
jgi:predicted RNA-binding Zn-ribbon protein involved in translation (DUF1610 family)